MPERDIAFSRSRTVKGQRFLRAALAPSLPSAVRVRFGRCAIVLFRRAALTAFSMFRFAARRCFPVVMQPLTNGQN